MTAPAENLNQLWAGLIVEELVRHAVTVFCLSPGSRSTPLAIALARHKSAETHVHFDERGAAFHALGVAKASSVPVALVCTSGTAAANYLPAVVEAAQSQTPLILLTADRPPELVDCGANQTIDQVKLFADYVRWQHLLPCPDAAVPPQAVLTAVGQAVYRAWRAPMGPVHINCPFREPLEPAPVPYPADYDAALAPWRAARRPYTAYPLPKLALDTAQQRRIQLAVDQAERGLLVVGQLRNAVEMHAVAALADALGWPAFPDIASGLRLGTARKPFVHHYDQLLLGEAFRGRMQPDAVIHIGGPIVSKRLQQALAAAAPRDYIRVADHPFRSDPAHNATLRVEADIARFSDALALAVRCEPQPHAAQWCAWSETVARKLDGAMRDDAIDEARLARMLSRHVPGSAILYLGNSMPIRDMDMYGAADGAQMRIAANRGASGIDGNIATIAGWAQATQALTVGVIGDLAALHDLNSLALLRRTPQPVVLVVINNDGGGIFEYLPIARQADVFERYFATPHGFRFADAARQFGLGYARVESLSAAAEAFQSAAAEGVTTVIEAAVDRKANAAAHRALQETIRAEVEKVCR